MGIEQIAILVILGLISFVNWVLERSAKHKAARETKARLERLEREGPEVEPEIDLDEQRRRFMEAMGLPPDEVLPESTFRRAEVLPPIPEVVVAAPERAPTKREKRDFLHKVNEDLERRLMPSVVEPEVPVRPVGPMRAAARRDLRERRERAVAAGEVAIDAIALLRSPEGLRTAVLAREVLGPCKALQTDG